MKKEFRYAVDWENENIEISKAFATAAQKAKTSAHKQLMEIRKAYPGFRVVVRKTEIKESKQTYKGLGWDEMRRRIIEWSGTNSPNLVALEKAIADKVPHPTVKSWFLGIYGEHYKRPTDVSMPAEEDTVAVGIADTAAANC